jgi:hypothetical protein
MYVSSELSPYDKIIFKLSLNLLKIYIKTVNIQKK